MSTNTADLEKAANVLAHVKKMHKAHDDFHSAQASFHDGLVKLHKGCADHHAKMAKLHKARHDEASDHFGTLNKLLGSEEADKLGAGEPKPINILSEGTPTEIKTETPEVVKAAPAAPAPSINVEELVSKITDAVVAKLADKTPTMDKVVGTVMSALLGEDVSKALTPGASTTPAPGIGDRTDVAPITKGLQVGPITLVKKETDTNAMTPASPAPKDEPVDMEKVKAGDTIEMAKFMRSGVRVTHEIPPTLSAQLLKLGGNR